MKIGSSLRKFGLATLVATSLYGCTEATSPTAPPVNPPVQNQAPDTQITNYAINGNTVSFSFSGSDSDKTVKSYEYTHDGTPNWTPTNSTNLSLQFTNGSHWFKVRSIDDKLLSDPTPASVSFSVNNQPIDTQNPDTQITSGPSGTIAVNNFQFTWTGTDNQATASQLVFSKYLNGHESTWGPLESTTSKSYQGVPNGSYTFMVRSKDPSGNIDQSPALNPVTVNVSNPNPEFLDILAEYPIPNPPETGWKGIDVDDTYIWTVANMNLEKRLKSDLSISVSQPLPAGIEEGSFGITDLQIVGNEIVIHAPPSAKFYFLDKNNPSSIKRTITVPITASGLNTAWSIDYLNGNFYLVTSNSTKVHKTDANLNLMQSYTIPGSGQYYYGELTHDNSNFWVIGCDYSNTNISNLWKLDSNFSPIGLYNFEYDTNTTFFDNPGLLDWQNNSFWVVAATNGIPTVYQHKGN